MVLFLCLAKEMKLVELGSSHRFIGMVSLPPTYAFVAWCILQFFSTMINHYVFPPKFEQRNYNFILVHILVKKHIL
jgi:hypothetical protein